MNKILSVLFSLVLVMALFAVASYASEEAPVTVISTGEGYTADGSTVNQTWELTSDGTLTLKPFGSAWSFDSVRGRESFNNWRSQISEGQTETNQELVTKIVIEEGFTCIQCQHFQGVFSNWPNLTRIDLGNVVRINNDWTGYGVFENNPLLTTITNNIYPEYNAEGTANIASVSRLSCTRNNGNIFRGTPLIEKVVLPETITSHTIPVIGTYMFYGCNKLTEVNFPNWITSIEANAFDGCTSLVSQFTVGDGDGQIKANGIVIPANITSIAANAFANTGISAVKLMGTETEIAAGAFPAGTKIYCISEKQVATLVEAGYDAVRYSETVSYGEQIQPDSTEIDYCWTLDTDGILTIKSIKDTTIDTDTTRTAFAEWHANWSQYVKHIVISDNKGLHTLYAKESIAIFAGYENLISIDLGNLYRIHLNPAYPRSGIFANNPSLTTVYSSAKGINKVDGVINISGINRIQGWGQGNGNLFENCTSITEVIFYETTNKDGVFTLGNNAFLNCTNLKSVSLATDITSIGEKAFYSASALKTIEIPATVTSIGKNAFASSGLESITFLGTDTSALTIDTSAFDNAAELKATVYSDAMKTLLVGTYGFKSENVSIILGGSFGDGSLDYELSGGILTISGTGESLSFGDSVTADDLSLIPWIGNADSITKVVITAPITAVSDYALAGLTNLKSVEIPNTLTDFNAKGLFYGANSLESVTVTGFEEKNGVIDLFYGASYSSDLFEGCATDAVVYLGKLTSFGFIDSWAEDLSSLGICTYPTSTLATAIRARNDIALTYLPESHDSLLRRSGTVISTADGTETFKYAFDDKTETLILSPAGDKSTLAMGDSQDQTVEKIPQENGSTTTVRTPLADGYVAWKNIWADAVLRVYVESFYSNQVYVQNNDSPFSNLTRCESIHFDYKNVRFTSNWPRTGIFESCTSLTTISYGTDDTVDGVIDLSFWRYQDSTITKMFKNCSSIEKIILPLEVELANTKHAGKPDYAIGFGSEFFYGCSSLKEIHIPRTFVLIGKDAFRNCTSLERIIIENEKCNLASVNANTFPKTTTIDVFSSAVEETLSNLGFNVRNIGNVLSANGFQIRLKDYNGLRALFSFDEKANETVESYGYSLEEYGLIVAKASEYDYWDGIDIKNVLGEYVTESSAIKKLTVYKDGVLKGSTLASTVPGTRIDFAGAVVKYSSNFKTDVYIGAYAIYTDDSGNYYQIHSVCEDSEGRNCFNIYDIALSMMINHAENGILEQTLDEVAVWNTLLQGADTEIYEKAVGDYDGITLTLVKEASASDAYIPFIRSENGAEITDEMIAAAEEMLSGVTYVLGEVVCVNIANENTVPAVDTPAAALPVSVTTPNRYSEEDMAQHCQGICTDGTYMYYSFTGKIVKVRISDEVEVGTMTVTSDFNKYSAHMGNLICKDGKLFISILLWKSEKQYMAVANTDEIVGDVTTDILKGTYYKDDLSITLFAGTDKEQKDEMYGGIGLDSITVGKIPGGGFILPDGSEIEDNNDYLVFATGSAYKHPTTRHDDDYLQLRFVDIDEVLENAEPITSARIESAEEPITTKYTAFAYAGATCVQCVTYDKDTGDYHFATYGRDADLDDAYPKMDYFVADGSKKLHLTEIYVGQNTPEDSDIYEISIERAAQFKDRDDLDRDGDTEEQMLGWTMDLRCVCGKLSIHNHEAIDYDNSGYAGKICGMDHPAMADQGIASIGNDYFYVSYYNNATVDGVTYYGQRALLYRLHHYNGHWSFVQMK